MENKKIFSEPKLDIIKFTETDIIATSAENFAVEQGNTKNTPDVDILFG